jgi:hypothetical protein
MVGHVAEGLPPARASFQAKTRLAPLLVRVRLAILQYAVWRRSKTYQFFEGGTKAALRGFQSTLGGVYSRHSVYAELISARALHRAQAAIQIVHFSFEVTEGRLIVTPAATTAVTQQVMQFRISPAVFEFVEL